MKSWIASATLLLFGSVFPTYSQAVTSDVFRVKVLLQGIIQYVSLTTNQTMIHPVQLNGQDLVNLALGRELGTRLHTNEVLAYCSSLSTNTAKVLVYDFNTRSNLATIGQIDPQAEATGLSKHRNTSEVIAEMAVPGAGNSTNGLAGGDFFLDGRSILETNGALTKFNATSIGFLETVLQATNYDFTCTTNILTHNSEITTNIDCITNSFTVVGSNYTVLVRSATITTQGKKIGMLIEGP
jgi:hypothetical protein